MNPTVPNESDERLRQSQHPFLLLKVRELYGGVDAFTVEVKGRWYVSWFGSTHGGDLGEGATEEEALLDAAKNSKS